MLVYFMQAVDGGPIKIGTTSNLESRHKQLEDHYRRKLAILGTIEGGKDREREIHRQFEHLRLGKTEQFRPARELMEFIGRPLLVSPNPHLVEVMEHRGNTPPFMLRLTDDDKKMIEEIRVRFGLPSMAAAIRYAITTVHRDLVRGR